MYKLARTTSGERMQTMCDHREIIIDLVHHKDSDTWDVYITDCQGYGFSDPIVDLQGLHPRDPGVVGALHAIDRFSQSQGRLFDSLWT